MSGFELAEWADEDWVLAPAPTPMPGTTAHGRRLVSNGRLGVDLVKLRAGHSFAPHTHPGDHVLIVVCGRGTITFGGIVHPTRPGEAYLVPGDAPHAVGAITPHALLAVGSPHRTVDDPRRMQLVEYAAVAAGFAELACIICGDLVRPGECPHVPAEWGGNG